jgi:preprotein translocase subunit YajC
MIDLVYRWGILAEAAAPPAAKENPYAQYFQFLPFVLIFVLFYAMVLRPQSREKQQRQSQLNALKKNDKVVTIGGLIGTVANLSADGKEVTLKVDDNTKLRFLRTSIQTVITGDSPSSESTAGA